MANINKITVGEETYNITIPAGLTEAEQAQIRQNIGAISAADADVVRDGTYPDMTVGEAVHAQNADSATNADKLSTSNAIDGVFFNGTASIVHYGVCSDSQGATEKTVACDGFVLVTGARITVNFANQNSITNPSLNVNGTGGKGIRCKGRSDGLFWKAEIITFVYDGTYWQIIDGYSLMDKPVGTLLAFTNSTSPAVLYGGSWAAINEGYYLKAITSGTPAYGAAGLPDIQGQFRIGVAGKSYLNCEGATGAFEAVVPRTSTVVTGGEANAAQTSEASFKASNYNAIYGNSETVTPLNRGAYMWYRTA